MVIVKLGSRWARGRGRLCFFGLHPRLGYGHGSSWGHLLETLGIPFEDHFRTTTPSGPAARLFRTNIITYRLYCLYNPSTPQSGFRRASPEDVDLIREYIHCESWPTMLDKNRIKRMNKALEGLSMGYRLELEE